MKGVIPHTCRLLPATMTFKPLKPYVAPFERIRDSFSKSCIRIANFVGTYVHARFLPLQIFGFAKLATISYVYKSPA